MHNSIKNICYFLQGIRIKLSEISKIVSVSSPVSLYIFQFCAPALEFYVFSFLFILQPRYIVSIDYTGSFMTSQFRQDINPEADEAETSSGQPRRTMCFDKEHLYARKKRISPLLFPSLVTPFRETPSSRLDLDHNANSWLVTSRCLRNKYYCPGPT